jgi:hypothetical protein
MIEVHGDSRGYMLSVVEDLVRAGWTIRSCPTGGRIARNGQKFVLTSGDIDFRFRLFVYKVTGSGRDKPYERRIEITSTYQKGLPIENEFSDIVLGWDPTTELFVGVDARRIAKGGPTGNASSFFDAEGLEWTSKDEIHVRQHIARLFDSGVEYHSFMRSERLSEYFFNRDDIHRGIYTGKGRYSAPLNLKPTGGLSSAVAHGDLIVLSAPKRDEHAHAPKRDQLVAKYEKDGIGGLRKEQLTPEMFADLLQRLNEIGKIGEEIVVASERKRLRKASRADLANKVVWVSQLSVAEGYDVLSFETSGEPRHIEVKASTSIIASFEMSLNEWNVASARSEHYYVYLVSEVFKRPKLRLLRNPVALEGTGAITRGPSGWRIKLIDKA